MNYGSACAFIMFYNTIQSVINHYSFSPVCAAADLFCADLPSFLHHLGSGQVQRNPHTKRTCGKRHRRRSQGREHVAPTAHRMKHMKKHAPFSMTQSQKQSQSLRLPIVSIMQMDRTDNEEIRLVFGRFAGGTRLVLFQMWENKN